MGAEQQLHLSQVSVQYSRLPSIDSSISWLDEANSSTFKGGIVKMETRSSQLIRMGRRSPVGTQHGPRSLASAALTDTQHPCQLRCHPPQTEMVLASDEHALGGPRGSHEALTRIPRGYCHLPFAILTVL